MKKAITIMLGIITFVSIFVLAFFESYLIVSIFVLAFFESYLIVSCIARRKLWLGQLYGMVSVFVTSWDIRCLRIRLEHKISTQKEKDKLTKDIYFTLLQIPNLQYGRSCRIKIEDEYLILTKE